MIKKWDIYKCKYINWWWIIYWHWNFEIISSTEKQIKLKLIKEHNPSYLKELFIIFKKSYTTRVKDWKTQYKNHMNFIKHYNENWFISYLGLQWIPFIFTKI